MANLTTRSSTFLVFTLGPERFGLAVEQVREVVRAVAIAALPKAPAIVEGIINYRGTVVPVLDIRQRFGFPAASLAPDQHFVLARAGPRLVALRVDRAVDLLGVPAEAIAAAEVPGAEYVAGIARLPDGLLVIHDLDAFLSLDEGRAMDAALADTTAAGPSPSRGRRP